MNNMRNKMNIKTVLIAFVLCTIFNTVQAQEPTGKVKASGLSIRSNSRDIQPRRRDNLHQRMINQKHGINNPGRHLGVEHKAIKPNKKAIQKRQNTVKKANKGTLRGRLNR
jgi:hypothetical protein